MKWSKLTLWSHFISIIKTGPKQLTGNSINIVVGNSQTHLLCNYTLCMQLWNTEFYDSYSNTNTHSDDAADTLPRGITSQPSGKLVHYIQIRLKVTITGKLHAVKELSSVCNLATRQFMIEKVWRNPISGMPWHISTSPYCRLAETLWKLLDLEQTST